MLGLIGLALAIGGSLGVSRPVVLNAIYGLEQQLVPTFGVYYGLESLQMIRVEFDFGMPLIIMNEDRDYTSEGVDCGPEFGCEVSDTTEYVTDARVGKVFATSVARFPFKLPHTTDAEGDRSSYLKFNMYRTGKVRVRNVVGLSPRSAIWSYIASRYGKPSYNLVLETDFKMRTVTQLFDNPDAIYTKLTFFDQIDASAPGFREQVGDSLSFSAVQVAFGQLLVLPREPSFSLNQPYLFRICEEAYGQIVKELHTHICPDSEHCETVNDLYGNLSGRPKFALSFEIPDDNPTLKTTFRIEVPVSDLFFVNEAQRITYNFAPFTMAGEGLSPTQIELGLLFMNRVRLEVCYGSSGRMFLAIALKKFPAKAKVYWAYIGASLVLSGLLVGAIAVAMSGSRHINSSSHSHSF